ncbi:MAG TPA: VOC family protein [Xanthobacteraceae bacterium]|nr:VOC family protein [Xanthobacteraceae bacterium]
MTARLNVVTIGVTDFARSVKFYSDLGFERRMKATGDEIAFFDAGGLIIGLFRWDMLAEDAQIPVEPRPQAFRGITLAQMCRTDAEVDAAMAKALAAGATLLKAAHTTFFGGYSGYFADPDGHAWEAVRAPGFTFAADGQVTLPD